MAEAGGTTNFNIYFQSDETGLSGTSAAPDKEGEPNPKNPFSGKSVVKTAAAVNAIKQAGKTLLNYGTSHVQMYTGSSDLQQKVNLGMTAVNKGVGLAAAYASNVYVGIFATVMEGLNLLLKQSETLYKNQMENRATNETLYRAGPSFNKSRK